MDKEIPNILYLFLHSRIFFKFGEEARKKEVIKYMYEWRIPKKIRPLILKEMMILKLVESKDRNTIILKRPEFDEEDCNDYYQSLNLFN